MTLFLLLKVVHVLAAIVAVGANVTYAFWLSWAGRDRERLIWSIEGVRRLDRKFANPGYIVVLITGISMVITGGYRFAQGWISAAIALYILTAIVGIAAFAPAIRRQLAEAEADPGSEAYEAAARRVNLLGGLTTAIVGAIVFLMVTKPI